MSEPPRAAAYLRVSSARQAKEGLSLDEQGHRTAAYIAAQGWQPVETYVERAVPGSTPFEQRPEFARLLDELDTIDKLVIPKLDRLGRSARDLLAIYERLEAEGVAIVSLSESIDTGTSIGKLLRSVLAGMAEFERDRLSERVCESNAARARRGRRQGTPRPFGYDVGPGGALVVNRAEAVIVKKVCENFTSGLSQNEIAARLNRDGITAQRGGRWHQSSISALLANPLYRGDVNYRGEAFAGQHEPIVERAQWAEAEQLREALAHTPGAGRSRQPKGGHVLVKGMLRCGLCGEPTDAVRKATRTPGVFYEVYACSGRRRRCRSTLANSASPSARRRRSSAT